jgi:hypothetical protein
MKDGFAEIKGITVRKTPHTTHKGGSREVSHVEKFNKQAGWQRKMVHQLFLVGLALSSIWEKARARDQQREVAGDKGQWGFVLQGMKPAAAQAAEWWQGAVLINYCLEILMLQMEKCNCYLLPIL